MTPDRDTFLAKVGAPAAYLAEAKALDAEAAALWQGIKGEFFTKAGKPRKIKPHGTAVIRRRQMDDKSDRAKELHRAADRARRMWQDPWSHTRPACLEEYGFTKETA